MALPATTTVEHTGLEMGIVSTDAAVVEVETKMQDASARVPLGGVVISLEHATTPPAAIAADKAKAGRAASGKNSLLKSLPTPSRNRAATSASAAPSIVTDAQSGPAPWEAPDSAAASKQSGYRELLQLRGQHAMQRSRLSGSAPIPPPATAAVGCVAPAPQQHMYAAGCQQTTALWSMGNDLAMHQVLPAPTAPVQQVHDQCGFQAMCGAGADGVQWAPAPLSLPIASRQDASWTAPVINTAALPSSSAASCTGSPCTPCTPQELMNTFVGSGAFAFDENQIAEALRAAAPEAYDD